MELLNLPPELLSLVLSHIQTKDLLDILPTCRFLNHIIRDLIRTRIRRTVPLAAGDTMYFECFHPTERNLRPALKCVYNTTPDFDATMPAANASLSDIHGLYSHYQLRAFPAHRNPFASTESNLARRRGRELSALKSRVALDQDERFTQLVARSGMLFTFSKFVFVGLELQTDVVRVFKDWLNETILLGGEREMWLCDRRNIGIKMTVNKANEMGIEDRTEHFDLTYTGMY
jgi:hypothetical protein